tara:strand:+ start:542 stop:724 length:183 start_codon:yes stop_codon:yes gene_type:complete
MATNQETIKIELGETQRVAGLSITFDKAGTMTQGDEPARPTATLTIRTQAASEPPQEPGE